MALIGTLVSFSAGTTIVSADVNSNFSDIRNAFNSSAVLNDTANTITVTHIFSVSQDFAAGIITSGTSTFGSSAVFSAGITVATNQTISATGVAATVGSLIVSGNATFASTVSLSNTTTDHFLNISRPASFAGRIAFKTAGVDRWRLEAGNNTESGADVGSNFQLIACTDAGAAIDVSFGIARQAGGAIILGRPTAVILTVSNSAALAISGFLATGANASSIISATGTWNTSGSPTALLINVTNTTSGASTMLIDAMVASVSRFAVSKNGGITCSGSLVASSYLRGTTCYVNSDDGGIASTFAITNTTDISANNSGVGTILFKGTTSRNSTGFVKVYIGTTDYYIPVFSAIAG